MNDLVTIQFRDGERDVPAYFAALVSASAIDFFTVTYEEARKIVNSAMERNFLNNFQERMVTDHLVRNGRWE